MGSTTIRRTRSARPAASLAIAGALAALLILGAHTEVARANTVAAINVSRARYSSTLAGYVGENNVVGVWSTFNGSEPPRVAYDGSTWRVILPDYYEILYPVVEPFGNTYAADGSLQTRAMYGYYICRVITYAGNEVVLTIHQSFGSTGGFSGYVIIGMTWYDGTEVHAISHMWDGAHRQSSTWFYFDENGTLVTL